MRFGILEARMLTSREVLEKESKEASQCFCRIAFAPIMAVEHVTDFGGSYCPDHANNAWRKGGGCIVLRGEELDNEIPTIVALVAALDPGFRLFEIVGG